MDGMMYEFLVRDIIMNKRQSRSRTPKRKDVIDRSRAPDDIYVCDVCEAHIAYIDKAMHERTIKHRNNLQRFLN